MEVFCWIPTELKFEVLTYLDRRTLVLVLTAYSQLQRNTVIITDNLPVLPREQETKLPTLSSLLPTVCCIPMEDIGQRDFPSHTYLKIFEFSAYPDYDYYQLCHTYFDFHTSYGVGNLEFGDGFLLWRKALLVMDRSSVITCSFGGPAYNCAKAWLLHLSWKTGATYFPLLDGLDDSPTTRLPRYQRSSSLHFSSWSNLKTLNLRHERFIQLESLPRVTSLCVEFMTLGRTICPVLAVNSIPRLRSLRIRYHGELVPCLKIRRVKFLQDIESYSDYSSWLAGRSKWCNEWGHIDELELTRIHSGDVVTPVSPFVAGKERESYKRDLSIFRWARSLSFSGVPDWFVLMVPYEITECLNWYRTDSTKTRPMRRMPTLKIPELRCLHICSLICNDSLPLILKEHNNKGARERIKLQDLSLTIRAPGFQLNRLLSSCKSTQSLILRYYDSPGSLPPLCLGVSDIEHLEVRLGSDSVIVFAGDIDLRGLVTGMEPPRDIALSRHVSLEALDIDLTRTAFHSPNNWVDMRYFTLGGKNLSTTRLRCSPKQKISLSLHLSPTPSTDRLVRDANNRFQSFFFPDLYLDWHIVHSTTFEGEQIVDRSFNPSLKMLERLSQAHFLFDSFVNKFVFCEFCDPCKEHLSREITSGRGSS